MRDANEPIFKNLSNILLLLNKTLFQKHKNIFDLIMDRREKSGQTLPHLKNLSESLQSLIKTRVKNEKYIRLLMR